MKQRYDVKGMTCSACQNAVYKAVKKLDSVDDVTVNLMTNSMDVNFKDDIDDSDVIKAVEDAGYSASVQGKKESADEDKKDVWQEQLDSMRYRLKISIPLTLILMYVSMGHMLKLPLPEFFSNPKGAVSFAFTQFLISIPVVFVNRAYYTRGFKSLFKRTPNMDSLIAIGSSSSLLYAIFAIYKMSYAIAFDDIQTLNYYAHNLYFESAVMILTLITLGKYFETKSKKKTNESISSLINLRPQTAHKVNGDTITDIDIEDVKVGDILQVKSGESIPTDGFIISGSGSVDESAITGESIPVLRSLGAKVIGATINTNGEFKLKVNSVGKDTTLSKIIELVKDANATKAPIESLADKISGIFVPAVIMLSILTFIIWKIAGYDNEFALNLAISVLVISCPCALGLATPVAVMVATGKGAQNGLLFKSAESLQLMGDIDTIVFDKTGTITQGMPSVTDIVLRDDIKEDEFYNLISNLEKYSSQPLAKAIVDYCEKRSNLSYDVDDFEEISGRGVRGKINSKKILSGNQIFMQENRINTSAFEQSVKDFQTQGKTPVYFAFDKEIYAIVAIADKVKNTSVKAIKDLKSLGLKTVMLTGDNSITANYIAKKVDVDQCISEVVPEEKDSVITKLKKDGKVAMVGDGINDSPALARADVGVAVGAGTDIAIESADLILMKSDLQDIVTAIKLSKKTIKNIKENLFWAFFYNVLCIPLAMGAFYPGFGLRLNPMIGSVAMSFSSLFVVSNALRLRNFKDDNKEVYKTELLDEDAVITKVKPDDLIFSSDGININNDILKEEIKMKKVMHVEGMMCAHCKARVEKVLNEIEGVKAEVNLDEKTATVTSENEIDSEVLRKTVTDAGYEVIDIK